MKRLKGTMVIELTDEVTGEVETITEENMVTNAVNNILGQNPMGVFYNAAGEYDDRVEWNGALLPICPNMIMGFSLLSMSEFFVFRKMETCETKNHPLCGCESRSYTKSPFRFIIEVSKPLSKKGKVIYMAKKANDLAHTKWMCKYHIVFTPKYRRKVIYNQYKEDLRDILKQLCSYKGVEILEGKLMPDHVHMLVAIPPKYSVSSFMGYLKGKSALMMFDRHANLKYKFGNRHFWSEGYYVSTVGLNEDTIRKYIKEQERYDQMVDKLSVKEYEDPFKG